MESYSSKPPIGSDESHLNEFIQRADDFYRIELLRQAIIWYKKASDLKIENEKITFRISECERLLAFENKVVYILITLGSALLLAYLTFFK